MKRTRSLLIQKYLVQIPGEGRYIAVALKAEVTLSTDKPVVGRYHAQINDLKLSDETLEGLKKQLRDAEAMGHTKWHRFFEAGLEGKGLEFLSDVVSSSRIRNGSRMRRPIYRGEGKAAFSPTITTLYRLPADEDVFLPDDPAARKAAEKVQRAFDADRKKRLQQLREVAKKFSSVGAPLHRDLPSPKAAK